MHWGCPPPPMLSKVCASWLTVLVLLPSTAPFSICDLTDLLRARSVDSMGAPSSTAPKPAVTRAALSLAEPFPMRAARHRPALARFGASSVVTMAPVPAPRLSGVLGTHVVHPLSCPIVLRI